VAEDTAEEVEGGIGHAPILKAAVLTPLRHCRAGAPDLSEFA
jgi:hypothetical protein